MLCQADRQKLDALVIAIRPISARLEMTFSRLLRATVVDDQLYPRDAVRLGSVVSLRDVGTGSVANFVLEDAVCVSRPLGPLVIALSITSQLALELLGMRVGDQLKWTLPSGEQRFLRLDHVAAAEANAMPQQVGSAPSEQRYPYTSRAL